MPKKKRRRRRIPKARRLAWERDHASQSRLRNAVKAHAQREKQITEARLTLKKVIAECYDLGATPEYTSRGHGNQPPSRRQVLAPTTPRT